MLREEKGIKGITLIALIITIIVLLILASVSVATLVGENGIITKAREAKEKTERAEVIEKVKIDILEAQIGSNGDITNAQLQTILTKYFKDIPETLPKDLTTLTLVTKDEYGKHNIEISEIYDAEILLSAKDIADSEDKSGYYGANVIGYNCTNSEAVDSWRIFYADENNIYLRADSYISYQYVPNGKKGSPIIKGGSNDILNLSNIIQDYSGLSDITSAKLQALNAKLFAKTSTWESNNMKAVAYMLDTNVWSVYQGQKAEYAIGGATLELLLQSYDQKYNVDYSSKCVAVKEGSDVGYTIYEGVALDISDPLYADAKTSGQSFGSYLASPYVGNNNALWCTFKYDTTERPGMLSGDIKGEGMYGSFRPLVCLKSNVLLKKNADGTYTIR